MHRKVFRYKLIGLSIVILIAGCGGKPEQSEAEKPEAFVTQSEEKTLSSKQFGVSVRPPEGWYALGFDQLNDLMELGRDVLAGDDDNLSSVLNAGKKNSYNLFAISQYEMGAPVEENPMLMGVAENISVAPGVKNGRDYFFHAKKLMEQSGLEYTFEDGYQTREIDGITFDRMNLTLNVGGTLVNQSYYSTKHGDYIISFIQSYTTNEGKNATSRGIDTIELDW